MNDVIQKTLNALEVNNYKASYFPTGKEAVSYIASSIHDSVVGIGDSTTLYEIQLYEALKKDNTVFDVLHPEEGERFFQVARKCFQTEYFFSSANALTETGIIVNMDGAGNRVGMSLFGHKKVFWIVGKNKIVPTLEDAIYRVRNVAAPMNTKRKGMKTPCAVTGKCMDCNSKERICNVLAIHYKKLLVTKEAEVIIIDENLGF